MGAGRRCSTHSSVDNFLTSVSTLGPQEPTQPLPRFLEPLLHSRPASLVPRLPGVSLCAPLVPWAATLDVSVFSVSLPGWGCLAMPAASADPVVQPSVMDDIEVWLRTDLVRLRFCLDGEWRGPGRGPLGLAWGPRELLPGGGGGRLGRRLQDALTFPSHSVIPGVCSWILLVCAFF